MKTEETEEIIKKVLTNMGALDISFRETKPHLVVVVFNCKEITSFVTNIPGWTSSGIQLDPLAEKQYKIEFTKLP